MIVDTHTHAFPPLAQPTTTSPPRRIEIDARLQADIISRIL